MRASTSLLCLIHRGIGALKQSGWVLSIIGELADTDAPVYFDLMLFDLKWFGHRGQNFLCDPFDVFAGGNRLNGDDEFITTDAGYGVTFPETSFQSNRYRLQKPIANVMAQRIVDILEPVQVKHQDCNLRLIATCQGNCLRKPILKKNAVRQSG